MTDRSKHRFEHVRQLVVIGTSTGGPKALQQVLTALPANFPAPILVVQHMPPVFTKSLAERLNRLCHIEVEEAQDSSVLRTGTAYIAPGDWHLTVTGRNGEYRTRLHQEPHSFGHRPSVDVLFRSILPLKGLKRTAVILTGMGKDGAEAMKALLEDEAMTIAEAEDTCVVYGMPRAAAELGAAKKIVPLDEIAEVLIRQTMFVSNLNLRN